MERMLCILLSKTGALDNLHLMYFQYVKRQRRYNRSLTQTLLSILAGKTDNNMSSCQYSPDMRLLHRLSAAGKVMTAINSQESFIISSFYAILHQYKGAFVQLCQVIQQLLAHAVWTRPDNYSHYILYPKCFLIHSAKLF